MPLDSTVVMLSATLGLISAAVTPRLAYRWSVPWGEPSLTGCAGCGASFPAGVRGWLSLRSRCPACRARTGPSTWWTIPVGTVSAGLLGLSLRDDLWVLPAALLLSVLGVLLAAIDLAVLRLPDPIVAVAAIGTLLLLAVATWGTGDWPSFGRALAGGACLLLGYGVLALVAGGGIGLGDVKLAGVLGLLLGWTGWGAVLLGGLLAILLNGVVAAILLVARRIGLRDSVPMGPSLLAGALIAIAITAPDGGVINLF